MFLYQIGQNAKIKKTGEQGEIKGVSKSLNHPSLYRLSYKTNTGRLEDEWLEEDELEIVS